MSRSKTLAIARRRPSLGFLGFSVGGSIYFWMACLAFLALIGDSGCASSRGRVSDGGYVGNVPTVQGTPGPAVVALPLTEAYVFRGPVQYSGRPWGQDQFMEHHTPLLPNAGVMLLNGCEYAAIVPPYIPNFGFNPTDVVAVFEQGSMGELPPGNRTTLATLDVPVAGKTRKAYGVRLCPAGHPQSGRDATWGINNAVFHFEVTFRGRDGVTETRHWGPFTISGQ